MTDVSHPCWSGLTQISGASRSFLAATQQEGYIFSRHVNAIARNSFSSLALFPCPQKIQPPPRLKSDPDRSPICRQPPQQPIPLAIPPV
ncbi:hypothetical protein QUA74_02895 [Microcoleus sp. LAD1_D3]|uniref:hypothetical protein n=1 Tax=Microcoleus sp. LAD1_D3 TaxID=2819365 RepID=UPI002FCEBEE1